MIELPGELAQRAESETAAKIHAGTMLPGEEPDIMAYDSLFDDLYRDLPGARLSDIIGH